VINSAKESQAASIIPVDPFRLSIETEEQPSSFEVVFLVNGTRYRYGFEVTRAKVVSEWLFRSGTRKEARLFVRDESGFHLGRPFQEGKGLETRTRPNALFLSVVAQWNGPVAQVVLNWFQSLRLVSGLEDFGYRVFTLNQFKDGAMREQIIQFVKSMDFGIEDIKRTTIEKSQILPAVPQEMQEFMSKIGDEWVSIQTIHEKFTAEGKFAGLTPFDLEQNESHGTQKLFFLAGPILETLANGRVLFIDEMEARLHPLLTLEIIQLFQSKQTNPKAAQLVFTTHDTNLLSNKRFRRDQIWFTEKDRRGGTHLYSLAELKVRNDASFESDYIAGKYGAIPYFGNIRQILVEDTP